MAEIVSLGRSPKAQLMGDAWMGIANNDEMTLFYNPASLGGNNTVSFYPLNAKIGVTNALEDLDRFKNFPSGDVPLIVDRLLGFPVYLEASTFPGLKMLHFGFNLFATTKFSMVLRNKVHPSFAIDYRYDRGFITGFAYNIIGGVSSKGKVSSGTRLSLGYGLKFIRREGLKDQFDIFSTSLLAKIEGGAGDLASIKKIFGFSEGQGVGHDIGLEYATGNGTTEFVASFAILDVGNTRFERLSGVKDVPMQEMQINTGMAFKQDFSIFDYALTLDIKPINAEIPLLRMLHAGINVNIPFVSGFAGISEGYISYGLEVRLWPVTVTVGFYSVELATEYKQEKGNRAMIYFSFFDGEFDIF